MDADNIVLIGMRRCGKTTLGRSLGERLQRPFVDLDEELGRRDGRPAEVLLAEAGEAAFRRAEAGVLRWAATLGGCVIATGGGAVLHPEAFAALAATGRVVYLQAAADLLAQRSAGAPRHPLTSLPPEEELSRLLSERVPLYEAAADIVIPVGRGDPILALLDALDAG